MRWMLWRPNRYAQIQRGWSPSAGRERRFWSGADLAKGARMTPLSGSSAGLNGHGPAEPSCMKQRTAGPTGTAISGDRRPALSQHRGPSPTEPAAASCANRGAAPGQHLSDDLHFAFVAPPVLGASCCCSCAFEFPPSDKNAHLPRPSTCRARRDSSPNAGSTAWVRAPYFGRTTRHSGMG